MFIYAKKGSILLECEHDVVILPTVDDKTNKYTVREYSNAKKRVNFKTA